MDLMVVYSRNNEVKYELPSYEPLLAIESAKAQRQLMSNDYVQIQIKGSATLDLEIGDWIEVKGAKYSIRTISDVSRTGEDTFVYNITFYGVMYELMRYKYRNTSINGRSSQNTFDLTFTLKEFLRLIVYNVMRVDGISEENINSSPWVFDENDCPETDPITMSFDQQNCLSALQNITKKFDVEFRIIQEFNEATKKWKNTIKVGKFGDVINDTPFSYGMGNGLYQLQENKVDDSMITNTKAVPKFAKSLIGELGVVLHEHDVVPQSGAITRNIKHKLNHLIAVRACLFLDLCNSYTMVSDGDGLKVALRVILGVEFPIYHFL